MEKFKLVRPTKEYEQQTLEMIDEFYNYRQGIIPSDLEKMKDYDTWLSGLEVDRKRIPDDRLVPQELFFLVRANDNKLIGRISVRLALTDLLRKHGGNIGYYTRPTERGKGYAKISLYLALLFCQELGLKQVLLDCDKNNVASAAVIEALGGKLLREDLDPVTNSISRYYEIDVNESIQQNRKLFEPYIQQEIIK